MSFYSFREKIKISFGTCTIDGKTINLDKVVESMRDKTKKEKIMKDSIFGVNKQFSNGKIFLCNEEITIEEMDYCEIWIQKEEEIIENERIKKEKKREIEIEKNGKKAWSKKRQEKKRLKYKKNIRHHP